MHHTEQPNNSSPNVFSPQHLHQVFVDDETAWRAGASIENAGKFNDEITARNSTTSMPELTAARLTPTCRLFNIPFEIRRLILEFALPYATNDAQFGYVWYLGSTSVLQTCHQLHYEGTRVMYSANPLISILDIDKSQNLLCARYLHPSSKPFPEYEDLVDCSFNHCRDILNWTRIYERKVSPETLGARNMALMRHWVLEIVGCNDLVGEMRYGTWDVARLTEMIRVLVQEAVMGLLSRAEKICKVTVQWKGTAPDSYTNRLENQKRILEPLRLLGISVEEDMSFLEAWR